MVASAVGRLGAPDDRDVREQLDVPGPGGLRPRQEPVPLTDRGIACRLSQFQDAFNELGTADHRAWFGHWISELLVEACEAVPERS